MEWIAQKGQDRWVLEKALPGKRGDFFLDLAATDGVAINNKVVMERHFGWSGIAIEPNAAYFAALRTNRACQCIQACVEEVARGVEFLANGERGGIVANDTDNAPPIRSTLNPKAEAMGAGPRSISETTSSSTTRYSSWWVNAGFFLLASDTSNKQ